VLRVRVPRVGGSETSVQHLSCDSAAGAQGEGSLKRKRRLSFRPIPRLTLIEAFERPGLALSDDPSLWEGVTTGDIAIRSAMVDIDAGRKPRAGSNCFNLCQARRLRAQGLL
jgi:hypothetical protein